MYKFKVHFVVAALAILFVVSGIGTTFAAVKYIGESVHVIDTAGVNARIVEEYVGAKDVFPGATVDKVVNVQNTGTSDAVVRVKIEKSWGEPLQGTNQALAPLPTDNITIVYNDEYWRYDANDGYFYYLGVLKPGESTLEPLFRSFSIASDIGNEYQGLEAFITVKMECVQAAGDGPSLWGKTLEYLGAPTYVSDPGTPIVARSTFTGGEPNFVFHPENSDLFANFKNLVPGETRSQTIEVANAFDREVEIFLRAENIEQISNDPETLARINKLLQEYVSIIVTDESGRVIYDGPIWGNPYGDASNPESMRYDISLGMFAPEELKRLNVQMRVDPSMGNEYQDLLGLIKWIWTAELADDPPPPPPPEEPPPPPEEQPPPEEPSAVEPPVVEPPAKVSPKTPPPTVAPKTGDTTTIWLWGCLMAVSGLTLGLVLLFQKRRKNEEPTL
ncbi:MAG: hypothetical protein FWG24_02475 [Eggerthellaceae bacterium]|nr:hypothetical protein [Eggerthellaceae bacterium]